MNLVTKSPVTFSNMVHPVDYVFKGEGGGRGYA